MVSHYDSGLLMSSDNALPGNVKDAVIILWQDQGVQECYRRAIEYQLNDSAP